MVAAPDLAAAVDAFERATGVRAAAGGRHPRWGTHNALLSLGDATYLEIIAPDPDRAGDGALRVFGLDGLDAPRLVAWAMRVDDIDRRAAQAAAGGLILGSVLPGRRERPDGRVLEWRLTDPEIVLLGGVVPFLIEWSSEHPARSAPAAGRLADLRMLHPRPEEARSALHTLGIAADVQAAEHAAIKATIQTPHGALDLL